MDSEVVVRTGVPVVRLADGRVAVILTPASAVICTDGTSVQEKLETVVNRPIGDAAIGNIVLHSSAVPLSESYIPLDGRELDLRDYPKLKAAHGDTEYLTIPNMVSPYPNTIYVMKVR